MKLTAVGTLLLMFALGCQTHKEKVVPEPWISKPVNKWPDIALTNDVSFADTSYNSLANAFLVNTGKDTIAVSCKHLFMVFYDPPRLTSINLSDGFRYWNMYPKNNPENQVAVRRLINADANEPIVEFRIGKDRDWIILELEKKVDEIYPLKIRFTPIEKGEIIYALGWGMNQENLSYPELTKLKCYRDEGNYYYVQTISKNPNPRGKSGSPVIDKNGYLVGIVSGAEGNLGVIGSIKYLVHILDLYQVKYHR